MTGALPCRPRLAVGDVLGRLAFAQPGLACQLNKPRVISGTPSAFYLLSKVCQHAPFGKDQFPQAADRPGALCAKSVPVSRLVHHLHQDRSAAACLLASLFPLPHRAFPLALLRAAFAHSTHIGFRARLGSQSLASQGVAMPLGYHFPRSFHETQ
jgi:hypothetical protein